jgi:hypothetical protein
LERDALENTTNESTPEITKKGIGVSEYQRGELTTDLRSLTERLDGPIEDVSVGVSELLTKIVRQSIKTGIQKLDEGLEESVRSKIDEDIQRRGPEIESAARAAAQSEVGEQVGRLRDSAKKSGERIMARIEGIEELWRIERETRHSLQTETDELINRHSESLDSLKRNAERALGKLNAELEHQQGIIHKQAETISQLQMKVDEAMKLSARLRQVEEKVFAPGFFGRLFGKKSKIPEIGE